MPRFTSSRPSRRRRSSGECGVATLGNEPVFRVTGDRSGQMRSASEALGLIASSTVTRTMELTSSNSSTDRNEWPLPSFFGPSHDPLGGPEVDPRPLSSSID